MDFPETDQVLSIKNVSVSSAGVVQHNYGPCDFLAEANIALQNDIPMISLVEPKQTTFIQTNEPDPYILFTSDLVRDMLQYRSSFRLTRLAVCILVDLGYVIYRARLFEKREV